MEKRIWLPRTNLASHATIAPLIRNNAAVFKENSAIEYCEYFVQQRKAIKMPCEEWRRIIRDH